MAGAAVSAWTTVIVEAFEESGEGKLEMSRLPSDGADGLEVEE